MDYEYPAVLDEEDEKKEHPYPAAQPIAPDPANPSFPPVAPPVGAEPSAPSLAVAAANTPAPKYSDYAPAAPHTTMGRIGRTLGDMFTGIPQKNEARAGR